MAFNDDHAVGGCFTARCTRCESKLGQARHVDPKVYGLSVDRAVVRQCDNPECKTFWAFYENSRQSVGNAVQPGQIVQKALQITSL